MGVLAIQKIKKKKEKESKQTTNPDNQPTANRHWACGFSPGWSVGLELARCAEWLGWGCPLDHKVFWQPLACAARLVGVVGGSGEATVFLEREGWVHLF